MYNPNNMTKEQTKEIRDILSEVVNYIYNDLDAMCDEDYMEEVKELLERVQYAEKIVAGDSQ